MNRSRRRQFDGFRSRHDSSQRSETSSIARSRLSQSTVSQACVNCVNRIMADRQYKEKKQEQERERGEFRRKYSESIKWVDPQINYREQMKKQALEYNEHLVQVHEQNKKRQKEMDKAYAQQISEMVKKAEEKKNREELEERRKEAAYFQKIHQQYLQEEQKKQQQKMRKSRGEISQEEHSLPLWNPEREQEKLRYGRQLLQQIQQKKKQAHEEEYKAREKQRKLMQQFEREARKYHADDYKEKKFTREQIEEDIRSHQNRRQRAIEKERKEHEEMRREMAKRQNEQKSRAIQFKMRQMQQYVDTLKNQMMDRENKLRASKLEDQNFIEKMAKSTEQYRKQMEIKRECRACHHKYPQDMIGPVPKKV